jgi:hypothetical protein
MQFLAREEARSLQKKLDRQIADNPRPKLVLYYESANRDYSKAANAITAAIGEFTEVTLLFLFCVTGMGGAKEMLWTVAGGAIGYGEPQMVTSAGSTMPQGIGSSEVRKMIFPRCWRLPFCRFPAALMDAGPKWSSCPSRRGIHQQGWRDGGLVR